LAYYNRGLIYHKRGDYQQAVDDYNGAIRIDEHNVQAYHNRSIAFADMGEFERAVKDSEEVARLEASGRVIRQKGLNGYQTKRSRSGPQV
jgi:tetratricopeptide (TPR) repeat protein